MVRALGVSPARADGDWQALNDAAMTVSLAGMLAVVRREVSADHVGAHGCRLTGSLVRLVLGVGHVFSIIDGGRADPAVAGVFGLVMGIRPMAAVAEAYARRTLLLFERRSLQILK